MSSIHLQGMATSPEVERYVSPNLLHKHKCVSNAVYMTKRGRAQELEWRSHWLSSVSGWRSSGTGDPGHPPLLLTPPPTNRSQQQQLTPASNPTPQSQPPGVIGARSAAQRAWRECERQQSAGRGTSLAPVPGPTPQPQPPGTINACSVAQRAWQEREHQQWLSSTSDVPPTPPPSNCRSRLGKYKNMSPIKWVKNDNVTLAASKFLTAQAPYKEPA